MARNGYTSRAAESPTDARQYVLPWSPTDQTRSDLLGSDKARSKHQINGSAAPSQDKEPCPTSIATDLEPTPAVPNRPKRNPPSLRLRIRVERLLRDRGIPYVNVDEAKRALFASAKLRAFHFVAYRKDGPNWLIFAAKADRQARDDMAEWERVFGEGFTAVLASEAEAEPTGIRFRSLDGRRLAFVEPQTKKDESRPVQEGGAPC